MLKARKQPRTLERFLVQISKIADPWASQSALTANVSPAGMRVVAGRSWTKGSRVLVKSSDGELWAKARVVYCQPIGPSTFAVGLEFLARTGRWIMGADSGNRGTRRSGL